jgi:hypothetical protein
MRTATAAGLLSRPGFVLADPVLRASAACTSTMNFFNLMLLPS